MKIRYIFSLLALLVAAQLGAQPDKPKVIDEIVAIVGDNYILRSDIDREYNTFREQTGEEFPIEFKYEILNQLISKKILLYKAQVDSVTIDDDRVAQEIDRRLIIILQQFQGDEEAFEKYLGKSIEEFKAQTMPKMREQLLVQEMQNKILKDIKITPTEVQKYYNRIPKDSLPHIDAEVTLAQIVRFPQVTPEEKEYAYSKINRVRQELVEGSDFCFAAYEYSQDPSSSGKCGETGYFGRGQMVSEFEAMAFKMKPDSISRVFETTYGYHIMKLVDRRGERINVRHILVKPQTVSADLLLARDTLEKILALVMADSMTFENAAKKYSEDNDSKANGGKVSDQGGNFSVPLTALDRDMFEAVKEMKKGDYYGPVKVTLPDGSICYKIYHLINEKPPHYANLEDDYIKIQTAALTQKKQQALDDWLEKNKKDYYIKISDKYAHHPALEQWVKR